ncbi:MULTISPECIES: DUF262 domain-containing protein [Acinetobacter]|uniref:DUF262 domain-containing protein n=1 Tax=Acinetobacter TaxID=469 RepID=UPI00192C5377|nr:MULTISPECIES: DUF262 domain-containing protein [Acinetobacter]MDS7956385.1 DUF262 domain-containing protein [Acinetobacter sp. V104_13]MDS7982481.1 DUF262 domain-containing protein [Acinetobacter sp. V104_3]
MAAIYTDPQILFIEQIVDLMKDGLLLCPKFQRNFVWEPERQIELLNSIRNGIPIGSIMVWETKIPVKCYNEIGSIKLPIVSDQVYKKYILDGLQRLTTLFICLNRSDTDNEFNKFYYDLKKKKFFYNLDVQSKHDFMMPMNILLDSVSLLKFQRTLMLKENLNNFEDIIDEIDQISAAFRQYKVPVIPISTDDIKLVTNTFQKINSKGVLVNAQEMIHALTWNGNDYDFNDEIESHRNNLLFLQWGDITEDILLKTIKVNLNLNIYKTDPTVVSSRINANIKIIQDSVNYLKQAILFFKEEILVPSINFLPYSFQLIILANTFYNSKVNYEDLNIEQKNIITNWFWFTSYTEVFSGASDNEVKKVIDSFNKSFKNNEKYKHFKKIASYDFDKNFSYNFRSVKTKRSILYFLKLFSEKKSFEETKRIVSILQKNGSASFSNIIESIELDEMNNKFYPTIANKYIYALDSSVADDSYSNKYLDLFLDQGKINTSLDINEKMNFLEQRFSQIFYIEENFYQSILDIQN